ncbi:uncharacterized protein ARMOST_21159 [Armillaria ostoyae]|uniref:Uncharacterized protein n=1 Tax=Armillaria ostoyae TaxID=47428 RepID=A0A284S9E7_ARMOS|nr:uncharacterized protein ARMOST_21159 [Armillaria ostoyae]
MYKPFFMIIWIITVVPIEVLSHISRFGYAFPFFNVSGLLFCLAQRIDDFELHFGVLLA